jgi:hypothetical protein
VAVTKLKTGYSRDTHRNKIERTLDSDKETEEDRRNINMTEEVWKKGEEGAKMLVCEKHRIILQTIDTKTQKGTKKERPRKD